MKDTPSNPTDKETELLEEILTWVKVANYDRVFNTLNSVLKTDRERRIYQDTGKKTQDQICKGYNIGSTKLTSLWKSWEKRGVVVKEGGRYRRLLDLNVFGLVPSKKTQKKIPLRPKEEENEQEERTEDN